MARVCATSLDAESLLGPRIAQSDFVDCYSVRADVTPRRAAEIITEFPGWVRGLLLLRRALTVPFGLSNDGPPAPDKVGPFPVEAESDRELVAGFDDRHLDFRVSVFVRAGRVSLATWVRPHNLGGRIYLRAILPFHILVAKNALLRVAAAQEEGKTSPVIS